MGSVREELAFTPLCWPRACSQFLHKPVRHLNVSALLVGAWLGGPVPYQAPFLIPKKYRNSTHHVLDSFLVPNHSARKKGQCMGPGEA